MVAAATGGGGTRADWSVVVQTAAVLAAAMGVGRFVFTPILPLMEAQAGLTRTAASLLATSNYLGYLVGALLGIAIPYLGRSRLGLRASGVALIVSLAVMPLTDDVVVWSIVRGIAGVASAVIFIVAGDAILTRLAGAQSHMVGWAYGGIGAGIALSGVVVAAVSVIGNWRASWWSSAALTLVLMALGWSVGDAGSQPPRTHAGASPVPRARHGIWFGLLTASYFLEGTGYILAGTFLVAAVADTGPDWLSNSVWTVVGLAAVPSCAVWTWLAARASRPTLITIGLVLQAVGIALPAVSGSAPAAVLSALLFGATFVGVSALSLATGRHLGVASAIAILTAAYGIGQVVGPLIVTPLLSGGYRSALLVGAAIVLAGAIASGLLRIHYPHDGQPHHGARMTGRQLSG